MGRQPAVVQAVADDAAVLLDPANIPEPSILQDKYIPAMGTFIGAFVPMYRNYAKRRPVYSGIQLTIASTLLGFGIGYLIQWKNDKYWADRDAIYRHYVSLHPEDFVPKERVLVGDMLKPWVPTR